MKTGVFYGVSVGPGDPELLTLKAQRILRECDLIAAPQTRNGRHLALDIVSGILGAEKPVLPLPFPMDEDKTRQADADAAAADAIALELEKGRTVAMVTLGDASIYSSCARVAGLLAGRGYRTGIVPGVASFCAAAAALGVSLTDGDKPVHILPGGVEQDAALSLPGTKVLLKSGRQLPKVLGTLARLGLLEKSMAVKNCGLPGEDRCPDLSRRAPGPDAGYFVTVIVKE